MPKPQPPRLRLLGRIAGLSIYLVSGEQVRDDVDIDFTMGGNEARYTYVPPGEIWIDDATHALDRTATALHEMIERDLMRRHGMGYDRAHDAANERERAFRRLLVRRPPTKFDARAVAAAYQSYLREESVKKKKPKQLDREIADALSRRPFVPDGRSKGRRLSDFDPVQLRRGTEVEMEHTTDRRVAQRIAADHLVEDPLYYVKLARVHLD